mgnify:CR=1 FL=1
MLSMSSAWRAMQPLKRRCERCGLYYPKSLKACDHCSNLSEHDLAALKSANQKMKKGNAKLGRMMFFCAVIIGVLLMASFV